MALIISLEAKGLKDEHALAAVPAPAAQPGQLTISPEAVGQQADVPISPFPELPEETRAAQELPEIGTAGLLGGEDPLTTAKVAPTLLATPNEQELADILTTNFPNIGITQDPGGNLLATNNKTGVQVILNRPGVSRIDLLRTLGIVAAFTPAAGIAGALAGTAAKVGGGAALAGLTQTAIEAVQESLGGELNPEEVVFATALGGAAEALLPAIQAFRASRGAKRLDVSRAEVAETVERIAPAREAQAAVAKATDVEVPLFQAQQTQVPSTLLKQRLLPQLDAGAKKAASELEGQNAAAFAATLQLIDNVAPAEVVATGAIRFRTASKAAIDAKKQARRSVTEPLFREALDQGARVDLKPVNTILDELVLDAPEGGTLVGAMKKIQNFIKPVRGRPPSLGRLQKAKFELDNLLENFGENALGNSTKREVLLIKKALVGQMEKASPLFKEAQQKFAELSPAVSELEDSIVGVVSKISDVNLKSISRRIFDAAESNPRVIRSTKKTIDAVDPGAFDDLLRVEFQRRIGGVETLVADLPSELVGNTPGQLRRAIFGNPAQRQVLLSGMNTEMRKNFVYLDQVLRAASSGRAAGSPTAPFTEALARLRGVAAVVRDSIFRPLETIQAVGQRGLFDRNVSKLTDVLFNPKWEPKLAELRKLDPTSARAGTIFKELMAAAKAAPQAARTDNATGS